MKQKILFAFTLFFIASCATTQKQGPSNLTAESSIQDAVNQVVNSGPLFAPRAVRLIKLKGQEQEAVDMILANLISKELKLSFKQKTNSLYLLKNFAISPEKACGLFDHFMQSFPARLDSLAWSVASVYPSAKIKQHIEDHISDALVRQDYKRLFLPAMADALLRNNAVESYSVVANGLIANPHVAFVDAMIKLKPEQAKKDLVKFLAPISDMDLLQKKLRQKNIEVLDPALCLYVLEYLASQNIDPVKIEISHLFYYAASVDEALSEKAFYKF